MVGRAAHVIPLTYSFGGVWLLAGFYGAPWIGRVALHTTAGAIRRARTMSSTKLTVSTKKFPQLFFFLSSPSTSSAGHQHNLFICSLGDVDWNQQYVGNSIVLQLLLIHVLHW